VYVVITAGGQKKFELTLRMTRFMGVNGGRSDGATGSIQSQRMKFVVGGPIASSPIPDPKCVSSRISPTMIFCSYMLVKIGEMRDPLLLEEF